MKVRISLLIFLAILELSVGALSMVLSHYSSATASLLSRFMLGCTELLGLVMLAAIVAFLWQRTRGMWHHH